MSHRPWIRVAIFFLMVLSVALLSCSNESDIRPYAPTETYPDDSILAGIPVKRAMVVIAHDDDMCAMAGTMALLNRENWDIAVISFTKTAERNAAQVKACRNIADTVMFVDLQPQQYRNDLDTVESPFHAIPRAAFARVFNDSLIAAGYLDPIREFDPSVIFTLDNVMGGYGHPEHAFVSQMVLDLSREKLISPAYVYQSVYTDHMERSIMARHAERMKAWGFPGDEWDKARELYGAPSGMPEPDVQIDISGLARTKMDYLRSYNRREREILDFFIPHFEEFPAEEYFSVFDREFFHVIEFSE